jgi:hypothetical protein
MALYEPLRDAFNEMNRMFIDRQEWQAEHERRAESDAFNRQQAERQEKRQAMVDEMNTIKLAKARQQITPRDFSIYELGDPENIKAVMADPKVQALMEKAIDDGGIGYKFSPADGGFIAPDGSRLQMSPMQAQSRAMAFYGIIDMHQKAPEQVQTNLLELQTAKKALEAERKKHSGPAANRFVGQEAEIDTKLAAINGEINRHQQFLDPSNPELFKYYRNKSNRMNKRAQWATSVGADALATLFRQSASDLDKSANLAFKALVEKPTKTGQKKVTYYAKRDGVTRNGIEYKKNESYDAYVPVGAEGAVFESKDFSTSRVPEPKETGAGSAAMLANRRAVFKEGKATIKNIALPNGMIVPKMAKDITFYKAVTKRYGELMKALPTWKDGTVDMPDAEAAAAQAVNEIAELHQGVRSTTERIKESVQNKDGTWTVPGLTKSITSKQFDTVKKQHREDLKRLGYEPKWEFKFGPVQE